MRRNPKLYLYSSLDRFSWVKKSYTAKIMLVAFLGTHIPLLTLLISFLISNSFSTEMTLRVLLIALLATLAGTAITLYILNYLLAPVILTSKALQDYLSDKALPKLPTTFVDEAGTLMADTSQTLHKLDELIHYITNYNNITGLPNRELFSDRVYQTTLQSHSHEWIIALLLFSIDDFANINHGLGHEQSNVLLRQVVQRLTTCISQTDMLGHINREEFVIARTEILSFESLIKLSQLIQSSIAKPFLIDGSQIHITVSFGITINSLDHHGSVEKLLQEADIALHKAIQQGRGQYQFYSSDINTQLQERLVLENELYEALEREEILVYYQPMIDFYSGQIVAMEALVRWQHSTKGLISPAKFIPIAEANGLIVPIGEWVLRSACKQIRAWQLAGLPPIRISVNLSALQFEQSNLVDVVSQVLQETGLDASFLELEVTESFLISNIQNSITTLKQLRELGILLALDDFGTGYSSLNYLKRLPVHILKIDQSFVQDVTSNPDSAAVTNAIIALAKSLRLNITAEGIETEEQFNYLKKRGCDEGQGYYISRPAPAEIIVEMLKNSSQNLQLEKV
ncbi:bifunctional diguanylate cyclase/phosphodiesterase [Anabaena cylindrica UHCC 0172]|uniref:putative bifunctional diguanylate cyclase/phosphodiesterase n=1 Tax=Anabaena cylindrica TaxID=1165 RepID=UPI002B213C18|nr:bifunctional diguanylate cyclase/phosphodiesterase [Anabaena cylindrica]MEA5552640.1 bifunctional diguanylate cyclase/phosphodiesterase [Anabaena cylindrica UHCC 0172]